MLSVRRHIDSSSDYVETSPCELNLADVKGRTRRSAIADKGAQIRAPIDHLVDALHEPATADDRPVDIATAAPSRRWKRPRHLEAIRARYGSKRFAFRRGHGPRLMLDGEPGTLLFEDSYWLAVDIDRTIRRHEDRRERERGTLRRLIEHYLGSPGFLSLSNETQRTYRRVLARLAADERLGMAKVATVGKGAIKSFMARRAAMPAAANDDLKKLRILMRFAIARRWRKTDPTIGNARLPVGQRNAWTADEMAVFEARWLPGTRQHSAYRLIRAGLRCGEAVRLSRARAKNVLGANQCPTEDIDGDAHEAPMLTTSNGRPLTPKGLGNFLARAIADAGLPPRCVPDGLRGAAHRRSERAGTNIRTSIGMREPDAVANDAQSHFCAAKFDGAGVAGRGQSTNSSSK